jgi:esterase/lipase superfamily enzyme
MHTAKFSLKKIKKLKKSYFIFIKKKKVLACIFGFNNRFIKVTRTGQYFKNFKKNYFVFILISEITTLYVRRILDIKFFCWR